MTTTDKESCYEVESIVPAAPLSEILRAEEVRRARLIKIDVEGAERDVVRGLVPVLESGRRDLEVVVEVRPTIETDDRGAQDTIFATFQRLGFNAYRLANDYDAASYLTDDRAQRPTRMASPPQEQTDIVFSRIDAPTL